MKTSKGRGKSVMKKTSAMKKAPTARIDQKDRLPVPHSIHGGAKTSKQISGGENAKIMGVEISGDLLNNNAKSSSNRKIRQKLSSETLEVLQCLLSSEEVVPETEKGIKAGVNRCLGGA